MSDFKGYLNDNLLFEEFIQTVEESEIDSLLEGLDEIEVQLNEFLGLGKVAEKLSKFSKKADEKVSDVKDSVKNAKEAAGRDLKAAKEGAKEVVDSNVKAAQWAGKKVAEKTALAKEKFTKLMGATKDELKNVFADLKNPSEEQQKVIGELQPIFDKIAEKKLVSGVESIKVLAAILAKAESGKIPSYKAYVSSLEKLRSLPGLSSYKFLIKKA